MSPQQADALGGDRGPDLGRLGDPLDQLLDLVRREQLLPDAVDELGVEHIGRDPLDRRAESVRWSASCAASDSSTRTTARSTAGLSSARTIVSSVADSSASSMPVAEATRSAPRAPIPSSRAGSGGRPLGVLSESDMTRWSRPGGRRVFGREQVKALVQA